MRADVAPALHEFSLSSDVNPIFEQRGQLGSKVSENWSLWKQVAFWIFLFVVSSRLAPFPLDRDRFQLTDGLSGNSLTQLVFIAIFVLAILANTGRFSLLRSLVNTSRNVLFPLFFTAMILLVATYFSPHFETSIRRYLLFLMNMIIVILFVASAGNYRNIMQSMGWFFAIVLLTSLIAVFVFPSRSIHQFDLYEGAWRGMFAHKNLAGAFFTLAIYIFGLCYSQTKKMHWYIFAALSFAFVFMTQSKAAFALLFAAPMLSFCLLMILNLLRAKIIYTLIIYILLFFCAISSIIIPSIFEVLHIESNLTGRLPLWDIVISISSDRPLIGHGFDAFFNNLNDQSYLIAAGESWSRFAPHSHNGYLNLFVYGGVFAVFTAIWFYASVYAKLARLSKIKPTLAFWLLSIMLFDTVRNVTEVDTFSASNIVWVTTIMAALISAQMPLSMRTADQQNIEL